MDHPITITIVTIGIVILLAAVVPGFVFALRRADAPRSYAVWERLFLLTIANVLLTLGTYRIVSDTRVRVPNDLPAQVAFVPCGIIFFYAAGIAILDILSDWKTLSVEEQASRITTAFILPLPFALPALLWAA